MKALKFILILMVLLITKQQADAQELYSVTPLNINTRDFDEFAAVPYRDGIVFISNRTQSAFRIRVDTAGKPLNDIYFAKKKDSRKFISPDLFSKALRSRNHESAVAFSSDGNTIYFTRVEDYSHTAIYTARLVNGEWTDITSLRFNMPKYNFEDPCLSSDGKRLFFASDRPGGEGGHDIYVSILGRSGWGTPKNLGKNINSSANEFFPFIQRDGKLFFASNRAGGSGGVDIYWSMEINGQWTPPRPLPYPVNTRFDDYAYVSDSLERNGFFSSSRNRSQDVFRFVMNFPLLDGAKPQKENKYTYEFSEESSVNTDTTSYLYEWDFGDGSKHRGRDLAVEHTFPRPGDYLVQLNVIDTLTGDVYFNQAANVVPVRDNEQPFISCADTISLADTLVLDGTKTYLPDCKIQNYYWDLGDGTLETGIKISHHFDYPGTYKIILGVSCENDASGTPQVHSSYREVFVRPREAD